MWSSPPPRSRGFACSPTAGAVARMRAVPVLVCVCFSLLAAFSFPTWVANYPRPANIYIYIYIYREREIYLFIHICYNIND